MKLQPARSLSMFMLATLLFSVMVLSTTTALAAPTAVISNLSAGTNAGVAVGNSGYMATGFTTPATGTYAITSATLNTYSDEADCTLKTWLYSNVSGAPGTPLVAFNEVLIPKEINFNAQYVVTLPERYMLSPSTSYWFVMGGVACPEWTIHWGQAYSQAPSGVFSYISGDLGNSNGSWEPIAFAGYFKWALMADRLDLPDLSLSDASFDFGDQVVGGTSAVKTITISNTHLVDLNIGTLTADPSDFALSNDTCSGQTLLPTETCTFDVSFSPLATGAKNGSISIPSNSAASPDSISLSGNGTPVDATAPTVISITRIDPSPTNLSSVDFLVTFSENVSGVDVTGPLFDDFSLTTTGASGAAVSGVSGTGKTYTVTVSTGTGNGLIRLNAETSGAIKDAAANPFTVGYTGGEVYSVVKDATFSDVPTGYWSWQYIERVYLSGITSGCSNNPMAYCPTNLTTRAQIAILILRGMHGSAYQPPSATGTVFSDVTVGTFGAAWIEQLAAEGISTGCGGGKYCPLQPVTRAQMAVLLVRATHGIAFIPNPATGIFADVPVGSFGADYIEQLAADGVTSGCGGGNFCPSVIIKRDQIAVFLVKAFHLP